MELRHRATPLANTCGESVSMDPNASQQNVPCVAMRCICVQIEDVETHSDQGGPHLQPSLSGIVLLVEEA